MIMIIIGIQMARCTRVASRKSRVSSTRRGRDCHTETKTETETETEQDRGRDWDWVTRLGNVNVGVAHTNGQ